MRKTTIFRLTFIFALLGGVWIYRPQPDLLAAPASKVAVQLSGDIVSGEGTVTPVDFIDLAFQAGGTVAELLVAEGEMVVTGDPLIRLEAEEATFILEQADARLASANAALIAAQNRVALAEAVERTAQSGVERAEANLALVMAGPLTEEISAAESRISGAQAAINQAAANRDNALDVSSDADLLSAQANLATANADLRQLEESYQDILDTCFDTPDGEVCPLYGPIEENTREQLEVARLYQIAAQETLNALIAGATPGQVAAAGGSVSVAIARRDLAQAELALLLAGPTDEQIVLAELAVEQATIGVEIAQAAVLQASAAVSQADVAVDLAETAVSQAQNTLDRFTLRAAKSGTVAQINANIGELVGVGVPVLTIADFSSWVIKTDNLTELNIPFINEGAAATISLDALGGEEISGTITTIALIATSYQGDVVYEVTISLQDTAELPLRWGMTGFVEIETSS